MSITVTSARIPMNPPSLRPLNILRDLPAVADLIEKCFEDTMDAEGRRYIQDMRRAGTDHSFLRWATRAVETASLPLTGFVWVEKGEIIGNVSTIPFLKNKRKIFLIANVAVRPDHRRQGIGRSLTKSAMEYAMQRHASEIWLHVRDDNPGAINLYQNLGFEVKALRTTWQAASDKNISLKKPADFEIEHSRQEWPKLETWYKDLYPDFLSWYQPFPWNSARPGIVPALYRFFLDYDVRFWSTKSRGHTRGAILCETLKGDKCKLWISVPPEKGDEEVLFLLLNARQRITWYQNLVFDFPANQYNVVIENAGFHPIRTLLWMKLDASKSVF